MPFFVAGCYCYAAKRLSFYDIRVSNRKRKRGSEKTNLHFRLQPHIPCERKKYAGADLHFLKLSPGLTL